MANNTSATQVTTGKVRFSYAHLTEPHAAQPGQDEKYSVQLLIPKSDTKTLDKINNAIEAAKQAGKSSKWGGKIPKNLKIILRDGDEEHDTEDEPAYKDTMFMNVSSNNKPGIVGTQRGEDGKLKAIEDEDEIYSGMYGRASINFFPYDANGSKGVSAGLNNVQKTADGERLGGGHTKAEDDFDDWEDEDESDEDLLD
jgi:intein/homing endonuclease